MNTSSTKTLGFSLWHQSHIDVKQSAAHDIARVTSVHKDSYVISKGTTDAYAELSGTLLYTAESALDIPTTGDWVYADFYDDDSHAIIHGVMPRKTLLKRKSAGKSFDFQLIAANIDTAFIMQSANENFNLSRLERYLVMVNDAGITPIILLSKCDLLDKAACEEIQKNILDAHPNLTLLAFSNLKNSNI